MESLLACYASDGEEEEEPSPAPEIPGKSLFASLPAPRNREESVGPPPAAGLFRSLPTPSRSIKKNLVQFRPPIDMSVLEEDEDEKSEQKKKKKAKDEKAEKEQIVLGGLVLPAPKNTGFGVALGSGGRRVDAAAFMGAPEPEQQQYQQQSWSNPEEGVYEQQQWISNPEQGVYVEQHPNWTSSAEHPDGQANWIGSEAAAAYAASYGVAAESYAGSYGAGGGGENTGGAVASESYDAGATAGGSYGAEYAQYEVPDSSEIYQEDPLSLCRSYGPREFPEATRDLNQESRKRKGREEPVKFVEIKQADLTKNRPREDQFRMTGIAFGSPFDKREDEENKPSRLHKRKHQIGSLYYDMRQKEFELMERRARGQLSKSQTMAKYGW